MKKITAVLAVIFLISVLAMCKITDVYTVTPDGWHMHDNVPVDTNLKD
jgi:preprotein translocase subunit SecG